MLHGSLVRAHPVSLPWYHRGSQGTGALPTSGQIILTPIISTWALETNEYVNPADGSKVAENLVGASADIQLQRFTGLYYADVFLYQDVDATLFLQERNILNLLDPTGATDQFKTTVTRVIKATNPYKERFLIMAAEARFRYVNGGSNTTVHDFQIVLRAL